MKESSKTNAFCPINEKYLPMNFWIIQTGEPLPIDGPNTRGMRAMNLTKALNARGHRVVLWSTDFYHQEKRHRFGSDKNIRISDLLEIRLITSRGYQRNIGPARFFDHAQLGWRFDKLACKVEKPDLAFIGFPPIEIAAAAVRHCRLRGVPALLDVKDLWPDLFEDPLPAIAKPLARTLLWPLHHLAKRAIRECSGICAPSDGFLEWARRRGGTQSRTTDIISPLTSPIQIVSPDEFKSAERKWDNLGVLADGRKRAAFIGALSRSFDLDSIIKAGTTEGGKGWQFVICGLGEAETRLRGHTALLSNIIMPGWIDRAMINVLLARSTVGLAPYRSIPNFELNVCNKVYDYMHSGVPIISPLQGDVRQLLEREQIGFSYKAGSASGLLEAMERATSEGVRNQIRETAMSLYNERFNATKSYGRLVDHLEQIAIQSK